jgi:hypothetical protein
VLSSHTTPTPSPHRAPSPATSAPVRCTLRPSSISLHAVRPRCCAPCLIPHACQGAVGVLPRCCRCRCSPLEGHGPCRRHGRHDA